MCEACARLKKTHADISERLLTAQRHLARHGASHNGDFERLWRECEDSLKTLWSLRQEMERHVCVSGDASLKAHAD